MCLAVFVGVLHFTLLTSWLFGWIFGLDNFLAEAGVIFWFFGLDRQGKIHFLQGSLQQPSLSWLLVGRIFRLEHFLDPKRQNGKLAAQERLGHPVMYLGCFGTVDGQDPTIDRVSTFMRGAKALKRPKLYSHAGKSTSQWVLGAALLPKAAQLQSAVLVARRHGAIPEKHAGATVTCRNV